MLPKWLAAAAGAALVALTGLPAQARDYIVNSVHIANAWTRATAGAGSNAVGYMSITNEGSKPDRLVGASCPVAKSTELHSETRVNGVMQMRPLADIAIDPGQTVKLTPGNVHLMLVGTSKRLVRGTMIPCTLTFQNAGPADIELLVRSPGASETLMGPMEK